MSTRIWAISPNAAVLYGTDVLEDLETGRGRLTSMHLKETVPGKFREIPYGTGHVDFEAGIKKAWELGVRRYVTELWYTGNSGVGEGSGLCSLEDDSDPGHACIR